MHHATESTVATPTASEAAERTAAAFPIWSSLPAERRAAALVGIADSLEAASDDLVPIAVRETGLSGVRLGGELHRTAVQLRLFADVVRERRYLDVRLDTFDADFALGVRPDLRRTHLPIGPVVNFAASNFPFAFSVAGGDTAAALAAGCTVVVKAHSGHPELSSRTAEIVRHALVAHGAPADALQIVSGQANGTALLSDARIRIGTFTGSTHVGRLLHDIAAGRPAPIPFYGELGSVNPVVVTQRALDERGDDIVAGFVASVTGSAGQLCTKPGFLFVPTGTDLAARIRATAAGIAEHRLLYPGIGRGFQDRLDALLGADAVTAIVEGAVRWDDDGNAWATPTFLSTTLDALVTAGEIVLDEAFGPLSVIVEYDEAAGLPQVLRTLFPGNLTGTLHVGDGETGEAVTGIVSALVATSGRVLFDGWPTGVAVTPAMQHGGPWPAATNDTTSVGTAAIERFLRGVAFQDAPQALLPADLRDGAAVPSHVSPAGASTKWGS